MAYTHKFPLAPGSPRLTGSLCYGVGLITGVAIAQMWRKWSHMSMRKQSKLEKKKVDARNWLILLDCSTDSHSILLRVVGLLISGKHCGRENWRHARSFILSSSAYLRISSVRVQVAVKVLRHHVDDEDARAKINRVESVILIHKFMLIYGLRLFSASPSRTHSMAKAQPSQYSTTLWCDVRFRVLSFFSLPVVREWKFKFLPSTPRREAFRTE